MNTARGVDRFLKMIGWRGGKRIRKNSPFAAIRGFEAKWGCLPLSLEECLKLCGIGCYNLRAECLRRMSKADLDLNWCTTDELEAFPGIGPKTSRFFILHTRRAARVAALDVHILKYLNAVGIKAPKTTPPAGKRYRELEDAFIALADKSGMTIADFDLMIWNYYTGNDEKIMWIRPEAA